MNNKKIEVVRYWLQLINIKEIQGFFGFINFYQRFIERFEQLTIPFIKFTKNNKAFE